MEIGFAPISDGIDDAADRFNKTFGEMGVYNKQTYYDPWRGIDERTKMGQTVLQKVIDRQKEIQKATPSLGATSATAGGAGTAGFALLPVFVDPTIVDQTRKLTPLVELIPRRANKGLTHDYNRLTAKGGATWKLDDAALPEDTDTYSRASSSMKFGYSVGRVTGPGIAAMAHYQNAMQLDLGVKTQSLKELEEDTIVNGDASTYTTEFNGLITGISTTVTDISDYVSLADIDTILATCFNARGLITLAVTDAATHFYVKSLLRQYQRQPAAPAEGLPFGIPGAFEYNGVSFIKSQFMPTTSAARRIIFLDMRYIYMAVLQDVTYEELAKTNDSNKFMLKVYEALIITYEGCMGQLDNLT